MKNIVKQKHFQFWSANLKRKDNKFVFTFFLYVVYGSKYKTKLK